MRTLLPPNATSAERAIEGATARIGAVPCLIADLWNPKNCPAALLPWLAWALSVDEWSPDWSEDAKRATIAEAAEIHRRKGTPWAIKRALASAGFGDAELVENMPGKAYDGTLAHNGAETYAPLDHWAEYRVYLMRPITIAQAAQVRRILAAVAPARCHLKQLNYTRALNIYDGSIRHDGAYSHGVS